jgi:hypothetical protein
LKPGAYELWVRGSQRAPPRRGPASGPAWDPPARGLQQSSTLTERFYLLLPMKDVSSTISTACVSILGAIAPVCPSLSQTGPKRRQDTTYMPQLKPLVKRLMSDCERPCRQRICERERRRERRRGRRWHVHTGGRRRKVVAAVAVCRPLFSFWRDMRSGLPC